MYSTVQSTPCAVFLKLFIFLSVNLWLKGKVWGEVLPLQFRFLPFEGARSSSLWIAQGRLQLLYFFGFFYFHFLNILWKCFTWVDICWTLAHHPKHKSFTADNIVCQCVFLPLSINIGFAVPVFMGEAWALLYVKKNKTKKKKQYCEYWANVTVILPVSMEHCYSGLLTPHDVVPIPSLPAGDLCTLSFTLLFLHPACNIVPLVMVEEYFMIL